jgi:hypothetical protein
MTPQTIWKFALPIADESTIELPEHARPLAVDMDPSGEGIALWVAVWPHRPAKPHRFYVRGTGHPLPPAFPDKHVGTVVDHRAYGLVWHVFDGGPA